MKKSTAKMPMGDGDMDECRAAHGAFSKACRADVHGMTPSYNPPGAMPRLGSGERFKALTASIAKRGGVSNPAAVAASIGRKKYGATKFAALGAAGRRRR